MKRVHEYKFKKLLIADWNVIEITFYFKNGKRIVVRRAH